MSEPARLTPRQAAAAVERAGDSLALTSGAGCGKTLVLAHRYATLLTAAEAGSGESPLDRLVALTFTEKAAAEMHSRVRAVLLAALAECADPARRQRLAEWITELPAARISTIHGFCGSLLRRHAVEAGVDPNFAVCADELVAAQMLSEAVESAVLAAVEAGRAPALELLAKTDLKGVVNDVRWLVERRIDWQPGEYADPAATLDRWKRKQADLRGQQLRHLAGDQGLRDEFNYLVAYDCDTPSDKLLAYRRQKLAIVERLLDGSGDVSAEDVAALQVKPGNAGSAKAWGGKTALMAYRARLRDFVARFAGLGAWFDPVGPADAEAARRLATLTGLAASAEGLYAQAKRSAGMLDFEDLIVLAARLLRDRPAVRQGLRRRLDQLLLDECQDTDANQLEMLWSLLAEGDRLGAGRLFVVGDLKQSIYRFRGARAEVFSDLCGRFGDDRIVLTESFRVHQAGAAFINRVFSQLMAGYEPIVSARAEVPPGASVEVLLAECEEPTTADAATVAQADLLAWRIAEMIGREKLVWDAAAGDFRPVRAGDVAVLFARMTKSLEYERALQQRGVPYYVVAGTGFFQQQEVYDVLNALRVVDNPFHDVALVGVLRSAMFGLDDNVLLHLASEVRPPYFARLTDPAVLGRLAAPQAEQLRFAHGLLSRLHGVKDALGPAGVVEQLLAATGYGAALLSEFNGRRKLGNVQRLVGAARSAQAAGELCLADFVRRYEQLVLAEARYEQAAVAGESEDVVRLMTIHKAKGLEFPVVFLPDLNAGFQGSGGALLFRHDWRLTCKPPADPNDEDGGEEPVSHRLAKQAEDTELRAEAVRKLYVAATRHRDRLVLIGADWRDKDGGFQRRGSDLARLDGVLGIAEAVDRGAERIPYGPDGHEMRISRLGPPAPARRRARRLLGPRIVAAAHGPDEIAAALARAGEAAELPLAGPLGPPPGDAPAGSVAATALADFDHCPMLYRWRHELRVPVPRPPAGGGGDAPPAELDPATAGTLFHRCMELLDFQADDLPAQAGPLVGRVLGEMDLPAASAGLAGELAEMLARFTRTDLCAAVRAARQRLCELSLVFRAGPLEITGQIDLLYQDADGAWHVVDYKSDRASPGQVAAHAQRYELQMAIYLAAARRHLGAEVPDATLYFLRPGRSHRFAAAGALPGAAEGRLADLAERLAASRRTGRFARREGERCAGCPCAPLCLRR